ncbi:glycosyltransferase family 9 protein [Ktedonospora formicarum]|uniref:Glycosyl transferase n=1 Tax=Ktedonospora formicarum TaxID=2778364 RepID=A0A8J3I5E5_9CHLR|nr:glycosyltransferase family 9 protein [Ktedonospora formicarum]GHO45114.1 glycosyl transferase [Ktedonospora formicarum]
MKQALRTLILLLVRILGFPRALAARKYATQKLNAPRILLLRPDHLGDMVMATPVLDALREQIPDADIEMLTGPWAGEIVLHHPALDNLTLCNFPGFQRAAQSPLSPYALLWKAARELRNGHYDVAINLRPDFWWGAALMYLAGVPRRVGYALAPATPFLTHALPFPEHKHSTFYNLELASAGLEALGREALEQPFTPERYPLRFYPSLEDEQWVTERLKEAEIDTQSPLAIIHPGTGGAVKLWRASAWATCANTLQKQYPDLRFVLTGTPKERPLLDEIANEMDVAPLLISDSRVGQLAALLGHAQLVMGVDNGPLHLAITQDVSTVRIFGPTDPRIFGPWGPEAHHLVIVSTERCPGCPLMPCGRLDFREEELPQHPCVRSVSEQSVLDAATRLLSPLDEPSTTQA